MASNRDASIEQQVLRRLSGRAIGLTHRELARSLKLRPSQVNECLLGLQKQGQVTFRSGKWKAKHATAELASNVSTAGPRTTRANSSPKHKVSSQPTHTTDPPADPESRSVQPPPKSSVRDRSKWSTFRRLCDYYAECVRLDQRSSITATTEEEFENIVCLDGSLPSSSNWNVRTRESWHKWVRKVTENDYVFVGFPLQRFRWRDSQKARDVDFISPVYILPCRTAIRGTEIELQPLGPIRVNEGWLERRLKNIDERKAFLELCGLEQPDGDDVGQTSWNECARLLNHFYPDWCAEPLDPSRVVSTPSLEKLTTNGLYNRAGLVVPKKWRYTNSLHQELLQLANDVPDDQLEQSALRYFFPNPTSAPEPRCEDQPEPEEVSSKLVGTQVLTMNQEQMDALHASAKHDLSIIVGPPGTGKSRVVAAVLAQQALLDRSALMASRNHQALEAVVPRVNAITEPWPIMLRLARPWGAPADMSLQAAIGQLVSSDFVGDREHLANVRSALSRRISTHEERSRVVKQLGDLREKLRKQLFELDEASLQVPTAQRDLAMRGNLHLPGEDCMRATADRLAAPPPFRWSFRWLWQRLGANRRLRRGLAEAAGIDAEMKSVFDKRGSLPDMNTSPSTAAAATAKQVLHFWLQVARLHAIAAAVNELRAELKQMPTTDEACRLEHEAANEVAKLSVEAFLELARQSGSEITNSERSVLANILATIENRSGLDTEADHRRWSNAMQKAFPVFLKHFPLAATTNLSIRRDIDLRPGIFDLLVIDEASQCDVASVIPLLFRAKRAMIVGDPMQLSHVTSLSSSTDRHLRRQFGVAEVELERFSYRTSSLFHLANTSLEVGSRVSLRQHHRCHPSIAAYCSETFYKGTWTVLTEDTGKQGISWSDVPDDCEPAPGGGAISRQQIAEITREVQRLSESGYRGSLGVVTPFRQQANRIRDELYKIIPHEFITTSRLLVDTADGFQGDERDTVLFSLVGGERLAEGYMRFLSAGPNRFNVAVSRAKQLLHVFADLSWARNCNIRHIRTLAEFHHREAVERDRAASDGFRTDLVGPVWEPALADAMKNAGLKFHQQYPACGRFLDFALFKGGLKLDVEVDGETYHRSGSGHRVTEDIRRDQALIASGWKVLRFWVYELREDIDSCVEKVRQALN